MSDYKKLMVWQKAKDLAVEAYRVTSMSKIAKDFGLKDQLLRAIISISSNIAEGYARETAADRKHFLTIARSSCAEAETQLIIASEAGLILPIPAEDLLKRVDEVSRMIYALRKQL